MAQESNIEYMPLDLSMKAEATPRTSRYGTQGASSTLGDYATICADAWRYQGYKQHTPTADETCNVVGVIDKGSTCCQPLESIRSIGKAMPSTSRAGMEEISANFGDGATNATTTGGREQKVSCGFSGNGSSRRDTLHGQPNKRTDGTAPMFRAHHRWSLKKSNHKCETCGKLFSTASNPTVHYRTHTRETPYKCEICHTSFAHRWSFHRHQQSHTGLKPHICQICAKPFQKKEALKIHLKSHSTDRPFICDICNVSFKLKSNLRRHFKTIHEVQMPYKCKQCGFLFAKKENLDPHLCQNSRCELCGESFRDASQLIAHVLTHMRDSRNSMTSAPEK